jgi:3-oxoacyl-[acyl-carrier protein] reductase
MDLKLKNKVVFVTASGRGIGAAIAEEFLEEGARVLLNDRNEEVIARYCKSLKNKYGTKVDYFPGDITDEKTIVNAKAHLLKRWEKIDILVSNLGTGKANDSNALNPAEWQRFMDINVFGSLKMLNAFLPEMKKSKQGSIVMIASITGIQRSDAPSGYSAAKSSIITLVKNLSTNLAKYGIRINCVAPGNIYFKNGRWKEIIKKNPKVTHDYIWKEVPLKRFGKPEEIASAVVFLASPISSFTTGTCLVVDGGETKGY